MQGVCRTRFRRGQGMTFAVAKDCLPLGLRAGAIVFWNVQITPSPPNLRADIAREVQVVRKSFASVAEVRSCPEVVAFQELHRRVGVNPRKEQSSIERLLLLAFKRNQLPAVNNLVDAYNL